MTTLDRKEVEEIEGRGLERLDRLEVKNFKRYLLDNPFYAKEVFGKEMSEEEIDKFIENNRNLFYEFPKVEKERRRL